MNNLASALTSIHGERVALSDVSVQANLHDLLAEVTVSQTYRNDEHVNIEAVYTFPLPLDAVLLDLQVEIGGRVLKAMVVEKKVAEERYEDAVSSGDAAVMLEAIEPGLYTMNVGNLLPQEIAIIKFSYAIVYRWADDQLRIFLPTTIAPRYGQSPHSAHQVAESSLTVENKFSLELNVFGALREAQFDCVSHKVTFNRSANMAVIAFQETKAVMDRDFVLHVKAPQATRSFVLSGYDGDGIASVASFQPFFPGLQQRRALNLAIVIDCSASMMGDSMGQAKQALAGILESLQAEDRVTLIAFGNTTNLISDRLLTCNTTNLERARRFARGLDASMGGTNIAKALDDAYSVLRTCENADVFLVTDGEVDSWEDVVEDAKQSGHRIFTVGVGSAVSEAFVRGLANVTGGECELVSPREGMSDRVIRHFERMRAPRASRISISWPDGADDVTPSNFGSIFEGDTVIATAHFKKPGISGNVVLEVETDAGEFVRPTLPLAVATPSESTDRCSTVARLAASERLKQMDARLGLETALHYRLISPWTNWLVIAERGADEKAQDLPFLRKVPQTIAAGWGGVGTVHDSLSMNTISSSKISFSSCEPPPSDRINFERLEANAARRARINRLPAPFHRLLALIEEEPSRLDAQHALSLLGNAGLESNFSDLFQHAEELGLDVEVIAAILLAEILGGPLGECLPPEAEGAIAYFQNYAKQATQVLQEMARHSGALLRAMKDSVTPDFLRSKRDSDLHQMAEMVMRFKRFRELLDHLQASVGRLNQQLVLDASNI
jgi:Ca-activated chloride channel family protein